VQSIKKIPELLKLLKREKHWEVTEARMSGILMEMEEADAEGVFDMPAKEERRKNPSVENC
jgi:hypothetical protein